MPMGTKLDGSLAHESVMPVLPHLCSGNDYPWEDVDMDEALAIFGLD